MHTRLGPVEAAVMDSLAHSPVDVLVMNKRCSGQLAGFGATSTGHRGDVTWHKKSKIIKKGKREKSIKSVGVNGASAFPVVGHW